MKFRNTIKIVPGAAYEVDYVYGPDSSSTKFKGKVKVLRLSFSKGDTGVSIQDRKYNWWLCELLPAHSQMHIRDAAFIKRVNVNSGI